MEDGIAGIEYRTAYGLAARLAEARHFSMAYGRDCASPAAGGDVARIMAEVLRPMALEGPCPAAVRAGIADALEGRKPRW